MKKHRKLLKRFARETKHTNKALRREFKKVEPDQEVIAIGVGRLEALVSEMRTTLGLPARDAQTAINTLATIHVERMLKRDARGRFKRKS